MIASTVASDCQNGGKNIKANDNIVAAEMANFDAELTALLDEALVTV